jgi:hypothetical protein
MNHGFTSMIWKQKGRVEAQCFALQQKSAQESFKNQDHAHCFFFYIQRVVHHKFVPKGQTVNAAFYVEVLKRLHERVRCVRPKLWAEKNWILHHDNAPPHLALIVRKFFAKNDMITMDHPSYSPDLAPCDFFLFPKVKMMQGEHFGEVENIKRETTRLLKNLISQDMQHYFLQLKKRWAMCIHSVGEYFEGDHVPIP